jgi:uncharacterized OsmC-like protein
MKPNNVNVQGMMAFMEEASANPAVLKKQKRIEGVWNLEEGHPQFKATLAYQTGERTIESDLAPSMGGAGLAPDPIQYCLYGLAACYAGTFVSVAASEGVVLRSLRVVAENHVDFTQPMGLGNRPIVERVSLTLVADTDADDDKLAALESSARDRCPGVYCITRPIPLTTSIRRV